METMVQAAELLVVDDSPSLLTMTTMVLERMGHNITTACNGQEALALLTGRKYDLVITDVDMPVMNGIEFLEELGNREINCKVLVVSARRYDRDKLLALGAADFMVKPFNIGNLEKKVQTLLEEQRRVTRFRMMDDFTCALSSEDAYLPGTLLNLSVDGALVEVTEEPEDLTEITLELVPGAVETAYAGISGEIVRRSEKDGRWCVALYFQPHSRGRLLKHLSSFLAEPLAVVA